jgi:hypothetical protein
VGGKWHYMPQCKGNCERCPPDKRKRCAAPVKRFHVPDALHSEYDRKVFSRGVPGARIALDDDSLSAKERERLAKLAAS